MKTLFGDKLEAWMKRGHKIYEIKTDSIITTVLARFYYRVIIFDV